MYIHNTLREGHRTQAKVWEIIQNVVDAQRVYINPFF